jgi:hypothetical protein
MMTIDMTAQLSLVLMALNMLFVVAGTAIAAKVWFTQDAPSRSAAKLAVVGSSSSAPPKEEDAPSDSSVPEAA